MIKSRLHNVLFYTSALVILLAACEKQEPLYTGPVIAEVGSATLTLDQALDHIPYNLIVIDSVFAVDQYRRQWVKNRVLIDEARRTGILDSEVFSRKLNEYADELAIQMLLEHAFRDVVFEPITREEAMEYYALHRENFVLSERHLQFHHMITETVDDANRARNELFRGEQWEDIVERYAVNAEYSLSNSNHYHPESKALADYPVKAQFIRVIGVTEVSPVRRIDNQYHFVQLLDDRKEGEVPNLEWAFDRIQEFLTLNRKRKSVDTYKQNLLRRAEAGRDIKIYD